MPIPKFHQSVAQASVCRLEHKGHGALANDLLSDGLPGFSDDVTGLNSFLSQSWKKTSLLGIRNVDEVLVRGACPAQGSLERRRVLVPHIPYTAGYFTALPDHLSIVLHAQWKFEIRAGRLGDGGGEVKRR
ncbi:hypothetical protein HYQ46_005824 [Verticillium longisporum]|nr:hypothetical protein HYQ46_005824 [Verticillium longisporum]